MYPGEVGGVVSEGHGARRGTAVAGCRATFLPGAPVSFTGVDSKRERRERDQISLTPLCFCSQRYGTVIVADFVASFISSPTTGLAARIPEPVKPGL